MSGFDQKKERQADRRDIIERKRTGIEPAMPPLSRSIISFEDRARHQSEKHFQSGRCHRVRGSGKGGAQ
jgi:hypothetical protein